MGRPAASDHPPNIVCPRACFGWISSILLLLSAGALGGLGRAADGDYERWYIVELMGQRAGWAMSSQATTGDRIVSKSSISFEIKRGEAGVAVSMEGEFVETTGGVPVSMSLTQKFGAAPMHLEAVFKDDGVEVIEKGPGGEKRSTRPKPDGAWLPPAGAASYVRQRLAAGADKIEVRTLDASGGLTLSDALRPVTITRTDLRPDTIRAMGKEIAATRCLSVSSAQPTITATEWIDDLGVPVRVESALGGIALAMTASERSEATSRFSAPELMVRTFVRPRGEITGPRTLRRAAYVLGVEGGGLPRIPATGVQRIDRLGPDSARVLIDLDGAGAGADAKDPSLLADSPLIAAGDEVVKELAAKATRGADDHPAARAEAMRRFVHRHINAKNLDVGFAGASEVARSRSGDCTEHGVLLAAMLRADGIPSRVAAGLVFAEEFGGERGVFAYHMWTQAALPVEDSTRWVDLDATMPDSTPMDATHIALAVSALGEDDVQDVFVSLATLLGRLSITVEPPGSAPPRP